MTNESYNQRYRIYSQITRSTILHLEDALDIGKVRLFLLSYRRGQGAQATADHYLDLADARVLASDLAQGHLPERFMDYKGSPEGREGKALSRVLKLDDRGEGQRAPIVLQISHGPGQLLGTGAIKPAGKADTEIAILLTRWQARRLGHALLAHLQAWEVVTFRRRTTPEPDGGYRLREEGPEWGNEDI